MKLEIIQVRMHSRYSKKENQIDDFDYIRYCFLFCQVAVPEHLENPDVNFSLDADVFEAVNVNGNVNVNYTANINVNVSCRSGHLFC